MIMANHQPVFKLIGDSVQSFSVQPKITDNKVTGWMSELGNVSGESSQMHNRE